MSGTNITKQIEYPAAHRYSDEVIQRTIKALRDEAAGNKTCSMTDLDLAVGMLETLLVVKKLVSDPGPDEAIAPPPLSPVQKKVMVFERFGWEWKRIKGKPEFFTWYSPDGQWEKECLFLTPSADDKYDGADIIGTLEQIRQIEIQLSGPNSDGSPGQYFEYCKILQDVVGDAVSAFSATAEQRIDAIGVLLGFWKLEDCEGHKHAPV